MDKAALLKEQKPFDGKKNCWIPDDKDGYAPAEIISSTGMMLNNVLVILYHGKAIQNSLPSEFFLREFNVKRGNR